MKVEAIHTIQHRPDPNGPIVVEKPGGEPFELAEADEWMLASGAVRKVRGRLPQLDHDGDGEPGGSRKRWSRAQTTGTPERPPGDENLVG